MLHGSGRVALAVAALAIVPACGDKSPVEPTPPAACTFAVPGASLSVGAAAGKASVSVTTGASCAWTAASDRGWMTITSGGTGTGPGAVTVEFTANVSTDARTGTLTIGGQAVAVRQDGAPQTCSIALSPALATFTKDAATGTFSVTTPASCAWSATSSAAWITITANTGGTGDAVVSYTVARNTSVAPRTGTIRIGDVVFTVTQSGDGGACEFQVSPVQLNACMAAPYDLVVSVAAQSSCGWTVTSDNPWITLTGGASRNGPGEIRFRVGDNYDARRLGVLKVRWDTPTAGQNVQVSQAGCHYAVSTTGMTVPADGGTFTFDVYQQSDPLECGGPLQNGCVWTAWTSADWITITSPMPHAGDDRVSFRVASNPGAMRSAVIAVRDRTVSIVQAAR